MGTFAQDIRLAFRVLLANRGFAAATLLTVALGVGGTAAVFSVTYGVLLRPLLPAPVVLVVAAASCFLPGRRAAAVAPAEVLVAE